MNRKGFSLVELLAVIIVLAIIALIATPIILGIIKDSRMSTFRNSINGILDAVEQDHADDNFRTGLRYSFGGWLDGVSNVAGSTRRLMRINSEGELDSGYGVIPLSGTVDGKGYAFVTATGVVHIAVFTREYCGYFDVEDNRVIAFELDDSFDAAKCIQSGIDGKKAP